MRYPILHVPIAEQENVIRQMFAAGYRRKGIDDLDETITYVKEWGDQITHFYVEGARYIWRETAENAKNGNYVAVNSVAQMVRYNQDYPDQP